LNGATEELVPLDPVTTSAEVVNRLKRDEAAMLNSTPILRKAGFDTRYMAGGHYGWKAIGGMVRLFEQFSQ
jgi:hypothetical protein